MKKLLHLIITVCILTVLLSGCGALEEVSEPPVWSTDDAPVTHLSLSHEEDVYTEPITLKVSGLSENERLLYVFNPDYHTVNEEIRFPSASEEEELPILVLPEGAREFPQEGIYLDNGTFELCLYVANIESLIVRDVSYYYCMRVPYATTSSTVSQDAYNEYYVKNNSINAYNFVSGEHGKYNTILMSNRYTQRFQLMEYLESSDQSLDIYNTEWSRDVYEKIKDVTRIHYYTYKMETQERKEYVEYFGGNYGRGSTWPRTEYSGPNGKVANSINLTDEIRNWSTMYTDKLAIRAEIGETESVVYVKDLDTMETKELFKTDGKIYLEALIRDKIIYNCTTGDTTKYMVYDMKKNESHENTLISTPQYVAGYTLRACYYDGGVREEFDYDKL